MTTTPPADSFYLAELHDGEGESWKTIEVPYNQHVDHLGEPFEYLILRFPNRGGDGRTTNWRHEELNDVSGLVYYSLDADGGRNRPAAVTINLEPDLSPEPKE
jgi:hypothetical protein